MRKTISALLVIFFLSGCSSIPIKKDESDYLYKRIPYTVQGHYRVINLFYASAREIPKDAKTTMDFKPAMGKELSYGTASVRIDPSLKIGKMLPGSFKKKSIIGLQGFSMQDEDVFMNELSEAISRSPHKSLLVMAMGYKDNFEYTTIKAAYFSYLLDIDTPVLLFDWPGDQPVTPWGYIKAESLAKESGKKLGVLLTQIVREVKPERMWIHGSSLGGQTVCSAFEEMYKEDDLADAEHEIEHVVLSAPDVSDNEFNHEFKKEITALSKKLTAYVSSDDKALLFSGFLMGERKFGRQKIRAKDPEQLAEAKSMLYLKSLMPDKIAIVDVTPINEASYKHGYYLEAPEFFDDVYLRIFDTKPHNVNRRLYLLKTKEGADYWVLQTGK